MKQQQASLQVLANKANARWVEKHIADTQGTKGGGWTPPSVLDIKTMLAGGVDTTMYLQVCVELETKRPRARHGAGA